MRRQIWFWLTAVAITAVVACRDASVKKEQPPGDEPVKQAAGEEEPLLLEEEPLLLEDPDPEALASEADGPMADNSRCFVCHVNYEEEELAVRHARADVGCETCHGPSYAHCSDEDNITPPDTMFAKASIKPACMACHETLTDMHKPVLAGTSKKKYCTDCHGEHRLTVRTRQWNKDTGELIEDDKVRMMTDDLLKKSSEAKKE